MKNIIKTGIAVAMVLPMFAFAASVTNVQFNNGDTTVQGTAGQSIGGNVRVVVSAGEVVENVEFDISGDNLAPVCISVGGDRGLEEGTHFVNVPSDLKFPPNTGTYTLNVKGSGIYGAFRAVDCNNNVVGSASFGSAVKTVGSSSNTGSGTPSGIPADVWAKFLAWMGGANTTPAPSAKCSTFATKLAAGSYGVKTQGNVALQGYLLSEGESIPALEAGAAFGLWLNQTQAAINHFKLANSCN